MYLIFVLNPGLYTPLPRALLPNQIRLRVVSILELKVQVYTRFLMRSQDDFLRKYHL